MPLIQGNYVQRYLNGVNSPVPSSSYEPITGTQLSTVNQLGNYADVTDADAANLSDPNVGMLFAGRYRMVRVDSGATVANVKRGTVASLAAGTSVADVAILTPGSGQTNGTYVAKASSGAAMISYTIAGGLLTNARVITGGAGYTAIPTFTIAAGGTAGTVAARMNNSANLVTSFDHGLGTGAGGSAARGVFLNAITPGNYGFIQEAGVANVLASAAVPAGTLVDVTGAGVVAAAAAGLDLATVGYALDTGVANALFRIMMTLPNFSG